MQEMVRNLLIDQIVVRLSVVKHLNEMPILSQQLTAQPGTILSIY